MSYTNWRTRRLDLVLIKRKGHNILKIVLKEKTRILAIALLIMTKSSGKFCYVIKDRKLANQILRMIAHMAFLVSYMLP
jgi:hypothetical protein